MSHQNGKRSRRRKSYRAAVITGISICFLAAAAGTGTVTLARYLSGAESGWFQITPERYYFTSDLLDRKGNASTDLYNWNQEEDYVFFMDIRNWEDHLKVSGSAIVYSVQTEGADGITSAVLQGGGSPQAQASYTLPGGILTTQKLLVTVPGGVSPAGDQIKVTVKAKPESGKGYTRTLSGNFKLNKGTPTVSAEAEVHNAYIDLMIGVDKGQSLTVEWPSGLVPDNTSQLLSGAQGTGHQITLEERSSCRLRFFIRGSMETGARFTVTEAGGTGTPHDVPVS